MHLIIDVHCLFSPQTLMAAMKAYGMLCSSSVVLPWGIQVTNGS
jgi:hypothetical protein